MSFEHLVRRYANLCFYFTCSKMGQKNTSVKKMNVMYALESRSASFDFIIEENL